MGLNTYAAYHVLRGTLDPSGQGIIRPTGPSDPNWQPAKPTEGTPSEDQGKGETVDESKRPEVESKPLNQPVEGPIGSDGLGDFGVDEAWDDAKEKAERDKKLLEDLGKSIPNDSVRDLLDELSKPKELSCPEYTWDPIDLTDPSPQLIPLDTMTDVGSLATGGIGIVIIVNQPGGLPSLKLPSPGPTNTEILKGLGGCFIRALKVPVLLIAPSLFLHDDNYDQYDEDGNYTGPIA